MNILIFRVGSIGDSIVALPALFALKDIYKTKEIFILCDYHESVASKAVSSYKIYNYFNLIDGFFTYQDKFTYKNLRLLKIFIKSNKISKVYYLMPQRSFFQKIRDFIFFKILGLEIFGINLFKNDKNIYMNNGKYQSESNRLLNKISSDIKFYQKKIKLKSKASFNKSLVIAIGTKHKINEWRFNKWELLIKKLSSLNGVTVKFIGGDADYVNSEILGKNYIGQYENYCGKISIPESIEIIANSFAFIGHDSGPMHLASLTNTEIIAIFSDKNLPGIWYPENSKLNVFRSDDLDLIEPEVIFKFIKALHHE